MATRFYFQENGSAPVSVSVDGGWESSTSPFASKPMVTAAVAGDSLSTVTGFGSTTGQDRCHRQWISKPLASGHIFNTSVTYKCYVQVQESAANDNIHSRTCVRIVSQDGTTVRHTVLAIAEYNTAEWSTTLRNKVFLDGDAGTGSYTTVEGDRLVVELGHNDSSGSTISGNSRWGSDSSATDLGENETETGTTLRPWFETSLNLTFAAETTPITIAATAVGVATVSTKSTYYRAIAATAIGVATLSTITTYYRTIAATAIGVANMTTALAYNVSINAVALGVATLNAAATFRKTIAATAVGVADLVTQFISGGGAAAVFNWAFSRRRRRG